MSDDFGDELTSRPRRRDDQGDEMTRATSWPVTDQWSHPILRCIKSKKKNTQDKIKNKPNNSLSLSPDIMYTWAGAPYPPYGCAIADFVIVR